MYTGKSIRLSKAFYFGKKNFFITLLVSTTAVVLYKVLGCGWVAIPFVPIGMIGTSVAFYIGFKNNQAYNRLWEARQLWGSFTSTSRAFATQSVASLGNNEQTHQILYLHLIYLNILRLQLRKVIPWATSDENLHHKFDSMRTELGDFEAGMRRTLQEFGREDLYELLKSRTNPASWIMKLQTETYKNLRDNGQIDVYEYRTFLNFFTEFYRLQGACERIKNTPLFRQYSIFSRVAVQLFAFLIPFGLLREMNNFFENGVWFTIPFALLISWIFTSMEQIGEYSENPFDNSVMDTPMTAICRNIEIDLREFLGETNLPERLQPVDDMLL